MRKRIIVSILSIFLVVLISCGEASKKGIDDSFQIDEATDRGKTYMKELSEDESNNISSYNLEKVTEASNYVVLDYRVLRNNKNNINVDLDTFNIKIAKKDNKYEVEKVKAKNYMQVYLDKNNIRIISTDTGVSELLFRRKDIPKEVYIQEGNIMINKANVASGEYYLLAIDSRGEKVGVITKNNNENLIFLAEVRNAEETDGEVDSSQSGEESSGIDYNTLEEALDKPVASKIVPYDLVKSDNIDKLVFTADGDYIVLHTNDNGVGKLLIYKNPSGEKVDMSLDKVFPEELYSLSINRISEEGTFIDVKPIVSDKEKEGLYKFEFKSKKIMKVED